VLRVFFVGVGLSEEAAVGLRPNGDALLLQVLKEVAGEGGHPQGWYSLGELRAVMICGVQLFPAGL